MSFLPCQVFLLLLGLCRGSEVLRPYQDTLLTYGNGATSERTLPVCASPRMACNVVHRRFWLWPLVVRLCKCPDRSECPWDWRAQPNHSLAINSRAQLKFCGAVRELPECSGKEIALSTLSYAVSEQEDSELAHEAELFCYCPKLRFFNQLYFNRTVSPVLENFLAKRNYYYCSELLTCETGDFCGHITGESYETYHRCYCPHDNLCLLPEDRALVWAMEPMFDGRAYRGQCLPY